jgi:oligoribonuclease
MKGEEKAGWLAWVDIETTGLDPLNDHLLEVGCVITEPDLTIVSEMGCVITSYRRVLPPEVRAMHEANGLLEECRGGWSIEEDSASAALGSFLSEHRAEGSPMCGSTVHFDRSFLRRYMPMLEMKFHYRNIDVSSVKELVNRWRPDIAEHLPVPAKKHRAIPDLYDTLAEARVYKKWLFDSGLRINGESE